MRVNTYFSSAVGWLAHSMPKSHSKVQASVCLIRKPASQRASEFARARPNVSLFTKLFFFSLLLWFLSFIQSICAIFQMNGRQRRSKGDGPMGKGKIHDTQKAKMMFKDFVYAIARTHRWWSHGKNFNLMCTYLKATRFVAFECSLTLYLLFSGAAHTPCTRPILVFFFFVAAHHILRLVTIFKVQAKRQDVRMCVSYCAIVASHYALLHLSIAAAAAAAAARDEKRIIHHLCMPRAFERGEQQMRCCRFGTDERCLRHQEVRKWHINKENK